MKLSILVTTTLLITSVIAHPEPTRKDFSVAQKEYSETEKVDVRVGENSRDDQTGDDDEESRRTKQRNGAKRRRRMRKRYRTTTESSSSYGEDELNKGSSSLEVQSREESLTRIQKETPTFEDDTNDKNTEEEIPRRRPGKRRRRPHRKQQSLELEESASTQDMPKPVKRRRKGGRRRGPPKDSTEVNQLEETTTLTATTPSTTSTTPPALSNAASKNNFHLKKNVSTPQSLNEIKSPVPMKTTTPETLPAKETSEDKAFGHKILDRKRLFSKPRRLPETSAILRRKLGPRENFTNDIHLRIIKPLANLESELDDIESTTRNEEKINHQATAMKPNRTHQIPENVYPIIEESDRSKSLDTPPEISPVTQPTDETTTYISVRVVTSSHVSKKVIEDSLLTAKPSKTPGVNMNFMDDIFKNVNFTNMNDNIIEFLKTVNISNILKSRNMTLSQLLDHRERGSSSFHLSDIFQKSGSESADARENTSSQINFPEEDVLGSFNRFLSDQIQQNAQVRKDKELQDNTLNDKREPRLFESMPDFSSSTLATPRIEPQTTAQVEVVPGWRVIPNPKLKPVSTRGNYKEIRISHVTSEVPNFVHDIDNIYLLNEKNEISHKSRRGNQLSANNRSSQETKKSAAQKIPVAVKSAIIIGGAVLALAIFAFLSISVSCRVRQKKRQLRAKQNILCEHLHNEDLTTSQQSLSPVLTKHSRGGGPVLRQASHSHPDATGSHRHYYLWRTIRKTFRYD